MATHKLRTPSLRVAIVHDWLIGGGAEKVVYELHKMFPEAPLYTSTASPEWQKKFEGVLKTSFLQKKPFPSLRKFVPFLRILWISRLKLEGYDLIISSSGAEAKGLKAPKGTLHINYCHAPTHYYWNRFDAYLEKPGFGVFDPLARFGLKILVGPLRRWDFKAAQRPDFIIANSSFTAEEVKKYYRRDATVIHPPVEIERFKALKTTKRRGFIITGRQTPYKKVDIAVAACTKLNLPLTVVGNGPDHQKLKSIAGPTISFVTGASDSELASLVGSAQGFLFPAEDDFGIAAVESLAAGTPVIAYKGGGAVDYIEEGESGLFFDEQTVDSLCSAIEKFSKMSFNERKVRAKAVEFAPSVFESKIESFISSRISVS